MSHTLEILKLLTFFEDMEDVEDNSENENRSDFSGPDSLSKAVVRLQGPKKVSSPKPPPTYNAVGYLDSRQRFRFRRNNGSMKDIGSVKD